MKFSENNSPIRILIIDDDADTSFIIKSSLSKIDAIIEEAANGEIALSMAENEKYDLVITDLMMPVLDGKQFIEAFREKYLNSFTPILVLTASAELDTKISVLEAGGDDFLVKPFNNRDLLAKAKVLLRINHLTLELYRRNNELKASNDTILALQQKLIQEEREKTHHRLMVTSLHKLRQPLTNAVLISEMLPEMEDPNKQKFKLRESLVEIEKILTDLESLDSNNVEPYFNNIEMIRE